MLSSALQKDTLGEDFSDHNGCAGCPPGTLPPSLSSLLQAETDSPQFHHIQSCKPGNRMIYLA